MAVRVRSFEEFDLSSVVEIHHRGMREGVLWRFSYSLRRDYFDWLTRNADSRTWVAQGELGRLVGFITISKPHLKPPMILSLRLFVAALLTMTKYPQTWRTVVFFATHRKFPFRTDDSREIVSFVVQEDFQAHGVGAWLLKTGLSSEVKRGNSRFVSGISSPLLLKLYVRAFQATAIESKQFGRIFGHHVSFEVPIKRWTSPKASLPSSSLYGEI